MVSAIRASFFLFCALLLAMVIVNEYSRSVEPSHDFRYHGLNTIHPGKQIKYKCSWYCHEHTNICKLQHARIPKRYLKYTDGLYFKIIECLKKTGNYTLANVILLVCIIPATTIYMLVAGILMQLNLKKNISDEIY